MMHPQLLPALGSALLHSFWQMGLLWIVVVLVVKFGKNMSPQKINVMSFFALCAGFAAFVVTFIIGLNNNAEGFLNWPAALHIGTNGMMYLAIIYLALLLLPVSKLGIALYNVYTLQQKGLSRVPGGLKIFMLDATSYLGIKRKVRLYASSLISSPLTVGFFKPIILLPVTLLNNITTQQAEAIILHELAHIRQNDYLQNFISQLIVTVLYFNPFAKALANMQNLEREVAADNWVLQFEYNNYMYASTLLQLARQNINSGGGLIIEASQKSTALSNRVQWIMGNRKRNTIALKPLALGIAATLILFCFTNVQEPIPLLNAPAIAALASDVPKPEINYRPVSNIETKTLGEDKVQPVNKHSIVVTHYTITPTNNNDAVTEEPEPIEVEIPKAIPVAVANTEIVIPQLNNEDEEKVKTAIYAAKKITAEMSWKQIETSLAETVTRQEKALIKKEYDELVAAANWKNREDILRINFANIDWNKAHKKLNAAIAEIKADSIYDACQTALATLNNYKKNIAKSGREMISPKVDSIDNKIKLIQATIKKLDSIKSKKIIEL